MHLVEYCANRYLQKTHLRSLAHNVSNRSRLECLHSHPRHMNIAIFYNSMYICMSLCIKFSVLLR